MMSSSHGQRVAAVNVGVCRSVCASITAYCLLQLADMRDALVVPKLPECRLGLVEHGERLVAQSAHRQHLCQLHPDEGDPINQPQLCRDVEGLLQRLVDLLDPPHAARPP